MNLRKMKTRQKVDSLSLLSELWGVGGGLLGQLLLVI